MKINIKGKNGDITLESDIQEKDVVIIVSNDLDKKAAMLSINKDELKRAIVAVDPYANIGYTITQ